MRDSMENGYLTDDGVVHTGLGKSSSNRFLDGKQDHSTSRKHRENLRTLSKIDIDVPETARSSSALPAGTSSKRNVPRKWKRSLSDSFQSRARSAPSPAEPVSKGSAIPAAPER